MLHPSTALLVWLLVVIGAQYASSAGLALLAAVVLMFGRTVAARWWAFTYRSRWLLLTLWLILAGNVPGEAVADWPLAPTYEGMGEANLHVLRLLLLLGCLAWLFVRLGYDGLVSGLWGLLKPLRWIGIGTERLVVRLSLVLENLQEPPAKGAWKEILSGRHECGGPEVLHLDLPRWAMRDAVFLATAALLVLGVLAL